MGHLQERQEDGRITRDLIFPYLCRHRHRGRRGDSRHLLMYFIVFLVDRHFLNCVRHFN